MLRVLEGPRTRGGGSPAPPAKVFVYDSVLGQRLGHVGATLPSSRSTSPPQLPRLEDVLPLLRRRALLLRLTTRTEYAFDGRRDAIQDVPLAEGIDSRDFKEGLLIVRLHYKSTWSSQTAKAQVLVFNMSNAKEEPQTLFAASSESAKVEVLFGDTAPRILVAALAAPIAAELRVLLRWTQGTQESGAGTSEKLALAVSLLLRP